MSRKCLSDGGSMPSSGPTGRSRSRCKGASPGVTGSARCGAPASSTPGQPAPTNIPREAPCTRGALIEEPDTPSTDSWTYSSTCGRRVPASCVPTREVLDNRKIVCGCSLILARLLQREAGKDLITPIFDRPRVRRVVFDLMAAASRLDVVENDWRRQRKSEAKRNKQAIESQGGRTPCADSSTLACAQSAERKEQSV